MSAPPAPPLLLASRSPQRRAILQQLAIPFDAVVPEYEEELTGADPVAEVERHALGKARSVAGVAGDRPVLGVDTEVVLEGRVYGKPGDDSEAEAMDHPRYDFVSAEWARKWPSEDIWRARKRA